MMRKMLISDKIKSVKEDISNLTKPTSQPPVPTQPPSSGTNQITHTAAGTPPTTNQTNSPSTSTPQLRPTFSNNVTEMVKIFEVPLYELSDLTMIHQAFHRAEQFSKLARNENHGVGMHATLGVLNVLTFINEVGQGCGLEINVNR